MSYIKDYVIYSVFNVKVLLCYLYEPSIEALLVWVGETLCEEAECAAECWLTFLRVYPSLLRAECPADTGRFMEAR